MTFHAALYDGKIGDLAIDDRQLIEAALAGVGVIDIGDLAVSAGSGMTSSVAAGRGLIRNTFQAVQGGIYLVRNDGSVSVTHSTADPSNPRIDQVICKVYDSETGGDSSDITQAQVVTGTPTSGATLDNRNGSTNLATFNNYILLNDVLVPANASSSASFTYRDRRPLATPVLPPSIKTSLACVPFVPLAGGALSQLTGGFTSIAVNDAGGPNYQYAQAMFLPRRIVNATKLRWQYVQSSSTAATGTYNLGVYDASGRQIVTTGAVAFTGTTSTVQSRAETITTTTFEAGVYYIVFGNAIATTNASINYLASFGQRNVSDTFPFPNTMLYVTSGGTTMPTTILNMTDLNATATLWFDGVPVVALSQT